MYSLSWVDDPKFSKRVLEKVALLENTELMPVELAETVTVDPLVLTEIPVPAETVVIYPALAWSPHP